MSSLRRKAWENLMVAGVNALVEQRAITLEDPEHNSHEVPDALARFTYQDGTPCIAIARDIDWGELEIVVAYDPTQDVRSGLGGVYKEFGRASAFGWLERRTSQHLQKMGRISSRFFYCERPALQALAAAAVEPQGFARTGKFFL